MLRVLVTLQLLQVMHTTSVFTDSNEFVVWTISSSYLYDEEACRLVSTPSP